MSELEPTRTCSNPTAIERLRALLTERGVEWRGGLPTETMVEADGLDLLYVALPDGRVRAFIRNYLTPEQAIEATMGETPTPPPPTMPEQPPYDLLIDLLRDEWDIDASWDGLRKFWYIGLTEDGCLMRDRACKAEAENAKLRELVRDMVLNMGGCALHGNPLRLREFGSRAKELGIEVDG